ncbi:MAG: spore maturation protein A [Ruminococcaceae bacterium]|nr:spore maturation protein A [Oscillospiraceae bacterium]
MLMSYIFAGMVLLSIIFAVITGQGAALAAAVPQGAQAGITLAISMAGSICLWSGAGRLMEKAGFTDRLAKLLSPLLGRLFPGTKTDKALARDLSGNICANFLGLGNAATPMGIRATQRMIDPQQPTLATDQMCRLIVLNTASIQLIPSTVAALRASMGCPTPFDILPAVWVTSFCSAGLGLLAAYFFGRLAKHG